VKLIWERTLLKLIALGSTLTQKLTPAYDRSQSRERVLPYQSAHHEDHM